MTSNLLTAGQSAIERPDEALDIIGPEEDQLAGFGRMTRTSPREYRERPVKPRFAARADKVVVEPEPREDRRRRDA